jgi:hypothetical protein
VKNDDFGPGNCFSLYPAWCCNYSSPGFVACSLFLTERMNKHDGHNIDEIAREIECSDQCVVIETYVQNG